MENNYESTKDNILYQSLTLFSEKGYEGVSMRDIAQAVGIKAASLYNHFKNKEDIFNSIINEAASRYEKAVVKMQVPHGNVSQVADEYMHTTQDDFGVIAENIFLYYLKDDFASKYRRMITMEQFRSHLAGNVYQKYFIDAAIDFGTSLFENMINQGAFIDCDPYVMALHFYSPMFLLLSKYDYQPEKEEEALCVLKKLVKQFTSIYEKRRS